MVYALIPDSNRYMVYAIILHLPALPPLCLTFERDYSEIESIGKASFFCATKQDHAILLSSQYSTIAPSRRYSEIKDYVKCLNDLPGLIHRSIMHRLLVFI